MNAHVTHRDICRLCASAKVRLVVKLEPIPLSENYSEDPETGKRAARYPVDLYMCADCGHVQQLDVVDAKSLWENYTYHSAAAKGMPEHFNQVAAKICATCRPPAGALVVDVGSNDGSLLRPFLERGCRVLGIDPAREIARLATEAGIETLPELMSLDLARQVRATHGPAHVVCAFNAFAHADDLGGMVDSIRTLLATDGLFFFEVQYLLDIIDGVLIGTIFHEHMSHHSVTAMVPFLERHGMELIEVEHLPIQHGSLIGTVQHKGGSRPVGDSVGAFLALEERRRLKDPATLERFAKQVERQREQTGRLMRDLKQAGATIAGYGAARSGPTLISQLGLAGSIDFIVDDHPQKVHRYSSGDGIPILPTAELYRRLPAYTVILAWVHAEKIIASNREYLEQGGRFIVLCPETRVIGKDEVTKI